MGSSHYKPTSISTYKVLTPISKSMSKHYLAKSLHGVKTGAAKWLAITALLFVGSASMLQGQAYNYTELATQTNSLAFGAGLQTVLAPQSTTPLILGVNLSTNQATGTLGNGWSGSAGGSFAVGALSNDIYSSYATTKTTNQSLIFGSAVSGLVGGIGSLLADVTPLLSHSATKTIAATNALAGLGSQRFQYSFDLDINNGLLGLSNAGILDSISVGAFVNGTRIAGGSVFADILGIASLTSSSYTGVLAFDYDPSTGPLEIRWSSSIALNVGLLGLIGSQSTNDIYTVTENSFGYLTPVPVPEPSSLLLCALGLGLILRRSGRQSPLRA